MTFGFDCRACGLGDAVVAFWIAQGLHDAGHKVVFLPGQHDRVTNAFQFSVGEASIDASFGGESSVYREELDLGGIGPHRAVLWQNQLPIRVEPHRPLAISWEECEEWALEVRQARTNGTKPFVVLFPAANYNTRSWPTQKWTRVAWELEARGIGTAALNGSPDGMESMPFYAYGYSIEAIISLIRVADVVIANDSGPAHLAGTLGTKTFAITGPTRPSMVFGYCDEITSLHVSAAELPCVGCHFKADRGFRSACDQGCEALHLLPASSVIDTTVAYLASLSRGQSMQLSHSIGGV